MITTTQYTRVFGILSVTSGKLVKLLSVKSLPMVESSLL